MARTRPHFKVHTTVLHHYKMSTIVADNELFGLWVKLGVLSIQRYASNYDNQFTISHAELLGLTNRKRIDKALLLLRKLVDNSTLAMSSLDLSVVITFPNLATKQGFHPKKETRKSPSYTYTDTYIYKGSSKASVTDEQVASMIAVRPRGVIYSKSQVRAWVDWIAPQIALKGHTDTIAKTLAWWPRAKQSAVDEAVQWVLISEAQARTETNKQGFVDENINVPEDIFRDIEGGESEQGER